MNAHRSAVRIALVLSAVLISAPTGHGAQPPKRVPHIGFLALDERYCQNAAFREGLRDLGYVEGRNIVIDCRHANGRHERFPAAAHELARSRPDVIVALNHAAAEAAQRATNDIPLIVMSSSDPVEAGFVQSFARPGGNITGLTYFATELFAKRFELLTAVVPGLRRVAVLMKTGVPESLAAVYVRTSHAAAETLGLEIVIVQVKDEADLERAFAETVRSKAQAVYVLSFLQFAEYAQKIADLAMWHDLPAIHFFRNYPAAGGLMSYGPDFPKLHRRAAIFVDKILRGAKPADLPIEQPLQFELVVNLATARELGLTIPQSILIRADRVIE